MPRHRADPADPWLPTAAPAREEVRLTDGDDTYRAGKGGPAVHVLGLGGDDGILGSAGDDFLVGGQGVDQLLGSIGNDLLFGGGENDIIAGESGRDVIFGGAGDDDLEGNRGADVIVGGLGADNIRVGQIGSFAPDNSHDRVIYATISESAAENPDTISFFDPHRDVIDVRRIDADTTVAGNQAFHFVGDAAFSGTAGELAYHPFERHPGQPSDYTGILAGDVDGDGQADFVVDVVIYQGPDFDLTEANFKL